MATYGEYFVTAVTWELHSGRLVLKHMPVTGWRWLVVLAALEYWRGLGHAILGEQYAADSGFGRGGSGKTISWPTAWSSSSDTTRIRTSPLVMPQTFMSSSRQSRWKAKHATPKKS